MSLPGRPTLAASRRPVRTRLWWGLAAAALFVLLAGGAWDDRAHLLTGLADLWIVSDPPVAADAVVVLGGGLETRPFAAAAYYRQGLVDRVLIASPRLGPVARLGLFLPDIEVTRAVLVKLGVPAGAIEPFGQGLANTRDEALALRDWAVANGARRILVPTEIFATRRVRWMLHRALGDDIAAAVPALDPVEYGAADWWRHERGVIGFQNEVIKYLYYRVRY